MYLFQNNTENKTTSIFITFITVFLFIVVQGFMATSCAGDVNEEKSTDLKEDSANESDILAEINGKTISTNDLLKQYNLYFIMSRFSRSYKKGLTINPYLDFYLAELSLLNEADDMGIMVTQDEVENEKKKYLKLYRFSEEILLRWLNSKTLTIQDAEFYFKNNLKLRKIGKIKFGIKDVSDEEAREYYKIHDEYYHRPAKIAASHILICHTGSKGCRSNLSKDKAKELAEQVRKLANPENFTTLAKRYSYDSNGKEGGSLGVIEKGSGVPAFEKAAFALANGEISNIVETDYGYHIIYVTGKAEEVSISFEEARDSIKYTLEEERITSELLKYSKQLLKDSKVKKYLTAERKDTANNLKDTADNKKAGPPVKQYSTFKATGEGIYRNSKGQPVILLFTRKGCHFCEWVEETFEEVVEEYVEKGLIEAHHYDFETKDDFLTPDTETEIPEDYLKLFEQDNPHKSTPYFNFGGMYYRRGTGYFEQDDLYAEEMEMSQIIDDLLRRKAW